MAAKAVSGSKRKFNETLKSARLGVLEAQYEVGLMYANGLGVETNIAQAIHWIGQAAQRGLAAAQYLLGTRYALGVGVVQDEQLALGWYLRAAEQGHAKAYFKLSRFYAVSHPVAAWVTLQKSAEQGVAEAQAAMGAACDSGDGIAADPALAVQWWEAAAQQGFPAAQCALGRAYALGRGVAADEAQALYWYRQAAAQNWPAAQVALSCMEVGGALRGKVRSPQRRKPTPVERRRSLEDWIRGAEAGDADARYHLGVMLEHGYAVESDEQAALQWYQQAAAQGHAAAQCAVGGVLARQGNAQALSYYQQAAGQGYVPAMQALGQAYAEGLWCERNTFHAMAWYLRAAQGGSVAAMVAAGRMLSGSAGELATALWECAAQHGDPEAQYVCAQKALAGAGGHPNWHEAVFYLQKSVEQAYVPACAELAALYKRGDGVAQDFAKAFALFQQAAEGGDAKAQWNLGGMYASGGPGLAVDLPQAFAWCHKSAEQGFVPALATLGVLFACIGDDKQALVCWSRAAQQGDAEAQFNLGRLYSQGKVVAKNPTLAFSWFHAAAQQGVAQAQARLGLLYATGEGVAQDAIAAHQWFWLAADAGDVSAKSNLQRSQTLLGSGQVEEGVRRAMAWRKDRQRITKAAN